MGDNVPRSLPPPSILFDVICMNQKTTEDENVQFEKVLDTEKLWREIQKWNQDFYAFNKLDFIGLGFAFAVFPGLVPLWFTASLMLHFNGKDITKKVKVEEVQ